MSKQNQQTIEPQDISSFFRLILEQQRGLRELVEDITKDIESFRVKLDDISVMKNRIDNLEKMINACQITKGDCQTRIEKTFNEIVQKRESINAKIAQIELELTKRVNDHTRECSASLERVRSELEGKFENRSKLICDSIRDIQQDIKKLTSEAGKYGGIIALIVSIVMFLAKAVWDHTFRK